MNRYLITTCSKEKDPSPGVLPAIERYQSERIMFAYQESLRLGLPMLILSGKFGLIQPTDEIPWYDHALQMAEVQVMVPPVVDVLEKNAVDQILFYARPLDSPGWPPYYAVIKEACKQLEIDLMLCHWEDNQSPD